MRASQWGEWQAGQGSLPGGGTVSDDGDGSGETPNWYYYWSQTSAAQGRAAFLRCAWAVECGIMSIDMPGNQGSFRRVASAILLCSGIADAAIYVGQSRDIVVQNNEVFNNVAGIEIENTRHSIVENNYVHDNTGGILVFITPGLPIKTTYDTIVRNNFIVNNNTPNFGIPGSTVSGIPAGTGILNMAGDQTTIEGNIITGNNTAGILVSDLSFIGDVSSDPDSEPNPDRLAVWRRPTGEGEAAKTEAAFAVECETRQQEIRLAKKPAKQAKKHFFRSR